MERFDRLLQTRGTCRTARQYPDRRHGAQGARVRRFRRVLEGAGQRLSHAPPRGGELRYVAGRFALHGGRLDVPLYDRSGQAARRFVARPQPVRPTRCTPTRCVPIHCVSIRWRPPPGIRCRVCGPRRRSSRPAGDRCPRGGATRNGTERSAPILWRRDGRTACAGILWRRIRCMSTRSFGIRCSRIRW